MSTCCPTYITFDCHGTLTYFRTADMRRTIFADRILTDQMDAFVMLFAAYRFDEVLGRWRPYEAVVKNAI